MTLAGTPASGKESACAGLPSPCGGQVGRSCTFASTAQRSRPGRLLSCIARRHWRPAEHRCRPQTRRLVRSTDDARRPTYLHRPWIISSARSRAERVKHASSGSPSRRLHESLDEALEVRTSSRPPRSGSFRALLGSWKPRTARRSDIGVRATCEPDAEASAIPAPVRLQAKDCGARALLNPVLLCGVIAKFRPRQAPSVTDLLR